jgi:Domain of unknown function (DUF6457)
MNEGNGVEQPPLKLGEWLEELGRAPGMRTLAPIDRPSERALLDLARIAAHKSERIAAPITAYLVGLAAAERPEEERGAWLQSLVAALETREG